MVNIKWLLIEFAVKILATFNGYFFIFSQLPITTISASF